MFVGTDALLAPLLSVYTQALLAGSKSNVNTKMILSNFIKLCGYAGEWQIQIQRFNADLISSHGEYVVRCDALLGFCIQKHTGNITCILSVMVFYIGDIVLHQKDYCGMAGAN